MSNSAISFNTAGLASTTSPGLVGTGAQTFAGKKTLDGGALIKGDTSGVAISGGYVGETKIALRSDAGVTSATYATLPLNLGAGIWLVSGYIYWTRNGATVTDSNYIVQLCPTGGSSNLGISAWNLWGTAWSAATLAIPTLVVRCDGTTMVVPGCTDRTTTSVDLRFFSGSFSSGSILAQGAIQAVRLA